MSNVPYRPIDNTPTGNKQFGVFLVALFGTVILLIAVCLISGEKVILLPAIFMVPASIFAVKKGIDIIKDANKRLKQHEDSTLERK